ncbi:hypothetical protein BJ912DRAFT_99898 [Pholiota molesta]|nr:hypothetical protein BJ912DRAFT_99898 [Pholiota molesta]
MGVRIPALNVNVDEINLIPTFLQNMESTTSPSSSILVPELIDLFISNVAARKYDEPLDWIQRRDLASCGLVSKSFYLPSRKYLFATIIFRIKFEQYRGQHFRFASELDGILSSNPMLQEQIHHLVIKYVEESSDPPYRDPYRNASLDTYLDSSHRDAYRERQEARKLAMVDDSGEEKLRRMISLLPALRKLSLVGNSYRVPWDEAVLSLVGNSYRIPCNEAVLLILEALSLSCPHLHRLRFSQMHHVPDRFIQRWPKVDDLELDRTDLGIRAGDLISGTFKLNGLSLKGAFANHVNWTLLLSDRCFEP